jgi:ParB-like chromosome segregation protein Spo0J
MLIPIDAISVPRGRRKLKADAVKQIALSIETIGLQTPISVRPAKEAGEYLLVVGLHRLEACRRLGLKEIEAHIGPDDKLDAALWEIGENLHRSDLTALRRVMLQGEWIKLRTKKIKLINQLRAKKHDLGAKPRPRLERGTKGQGIGGGRPSSGIRAAARELNIPETTARRAVRITNRLTVAAQKEAVKLGLDNNQLVLDRVADNLPDHQVAAVHYFAEEKQEQQKKRQERIATQEQIARRLAGTETPPTDGEGAFSHWYWQLDSVRQRNVRHWLRGLDAFGLADELEALSVASAVH